MALAPASKAELRRTSPRASASATRVKPISVTESVAQNIVAMITSGRIKPGEKLPTEYELMQMLEVGRSSVREAVRGLVIMGLLEARTRRGTIVVCPVANAFSDPPKSSVALWALRDLYEVRLLLEEHAAGLAAHLATAADLAEIERNADAVARKVARGKSYLGENLNFHLSIAKAAHNSVLLYSLRNIIGAFRELREDISRLLHNLHAQDVKEHNEILRAIKARRAPEARRLMRAHLAYYIAELDALPAAPPRLGPA